MKRYEQTFSDAGEIFSEAYALLTCTEQIIFDTIMNFFPDPAPTAHILHAIVQHNNDVQNYYPKNNIEVSVCRMRKKFKQHGLSYNLESVQGYGFMLVHPEIKPTWWISLSEVERSILLLLLESSTPYTYLRLFNEFKPINDDYYILDRNYVHTIISRIDRKLEQVLTPPHALPIGKRKNSEPLYASDLNSYYTKERMIEDLNASLAK